MSVTDFIRKLEQGTGIDRSLDAHLARLIGWTRKVEYIHQDGDEPTRKAMWADPGGVEAVVPYFTSSLDDAVEFAKQLLPGGAGGVSWDNGTYTATVSNGPYCSSPTSAIAVCLAALKAKHYGPGK